MGGGEGELCKYTGGGEVGGETVRCGDRLPTSGPNCSELGC